MKKIILSCLCLSCFAMGVSAAEVLVIPAPSEKPFDLTSYSSPEIAAICAEAKAARTAKDFEKSNSLLEDAAKKSSS